jgi:hypothetical protein
MVINMFRDMLVSLCLNWCFITCVNSSGKYILKWFFDWGSIDGDTVLLLILFSLWMSILISVILSRKYLLLVTFPFVFYFIQY